MILKLTQMLNTFVPMSGFLYFWNLIIKRRKKSYYDWILPGWILRLMSWKLKDTLTINVLFDEINLINVDLIGRNCNEVRWKTPVGPLYCLHSCSFLLTYCPERLWLHNNPLDESPLGKQTKHDLPRIVVGKYNEISMKPYSTLNRSVMFSYITMLTTYKNLSKAIAVVFYLFISSMMIKVILSK